MKQHPGKENSDKSCCFTILSVDQHNYHLIQEWYYA